MIPPPDPHQLLPVLRRLAIDAGAEIMRIRASARLGIHEKADGSPVTRADLAADALISAGLRAAFPQLALVTEEDPASHRQQADSFLIVDPLDGTRDFMRGGEDFTVNIAWVERLVPRFGVIYAPARRRLFLTAPDGGAREELGGPDRPWCARAIHAAPANGHALRLVASKSHRGPDTDAFIARQAAGSVTYAGSSLKFCLLACGEADLYPRLSPTMEWDTAAGQAILSAAGGRVQLLSDSRPPRYGKPGFRNPAFVALVPGVEVRTGAT